MCVHVPISSTPYLCITWFWLLQKSYWSAQVQTELDCWKLGLQHHAAELDNARTLRNTLVQPRICRWLCVASSLPQGALWAVPDTHNAIAMCHRRLGQHKLAAQAFIAALGHEPRRPDLLLQLGLTQHISGVLHVVGCALIASQFSHSSMSVDWNERFDSALIRV